MSRVATSEPVGLQLAPGSDTSDTDAIAAAGVPDIDAEAMVRAVISALVRAPLD